MVEKSKTQKLFGAGGAQRYAYILLITTSLFCGCSQNNTPLRSSDELSELFDLLDGVKNGGIYWGESWRRARPKVKTFLKSPNAVPPFDPKLMSVEMQFSEGHDSYGLAFIIWVSEKPLDANGVMFSLEDKTTVSINFDSGILEGNEFVYNEYNCPVFLTNLICKFIVNKDTNEPYEPTKIRRAQLIKDGKPVGNFVDVVIVTSDVVTPTPNLKSSDENSGN